MMRTGFIAAALWLLAAGGVMAQEVEPAPAPSALAGRSGYVSIGLNGGFMVDPDMTAGLLSLDYYITDEISVGPYLHIGGSGDDSYWGVSGQMKYSAELANNPSIRPYGTVGIGFVELDFDDMDSSETTYFFPVGGGLEFELTDIISADVGAYFMITEDTFAGLTAGVRILL